MSRLLAVAFILFCFEVGFFLILAPWLDLWDANFLLDHLSVLRPVMSNFFFRAGVSFLGAIDVFIGLVELRYFVKSFKVAKRSPL